MNLPSHSITKNLGGKGNEKHTTTEKRVALNKGLDGQSSEDDK